jgi:polyphosphate kinase 2 (PPK2 family)
LPSVQLQASQRRRFEHDFLWRTTRDLPERGRIGIFNRSYYEEVLILRVHPELLRGEALVDLPGNDKAFWHYRYRSITNLERHLHANGTRVVKFFLHLSKEEQRKRYLFAYRRAGHELEIQRSGYHGKGLLEGVYEGV